MSDPGLDELREARREFDAVVDEIRAVGGFGDFLAPPDFEDVANAAAGAPVVYLAAAEPGGLALVVCGEDVHHVALAALTAEALRARVSAHPSTYLEYQLGEGSEPWADSLDTLCGWLWEAAMGPVCAALADSTQATLIAGGLLGLLPLHAAWTQDATAPTGRHYAIDELLLSYAPNARTLRAARATAERLPGDRLLAVAEPRPVSGAALPCAALEGDIAAAALPAAPVVLRAGAATRRRSGPQISSPRWTAASGWPATARSRCATYSRSSWRSGSPCCRPARRHFLGPSFPTRSSRCRRDYCRRGSPA